MEGQELPNFDYKPPPHSKKHPWEIQKRKYTDPEMLQCIQKKKSGKFTIRKCVEGTDIAISSLFTKEKQIDNGGPMRPPLGPKRKIEAATEDEMFDYLCFCWDLGIPLTQERFSEEIVHYLEYYGIANKFAKIFPGDGWFRRFKKEQKVRFVRKGQENKFRFEDVTQEKWESENVRYILDHNEGVLSLSEESIFVVECEDLVWHQEHIMNFPVVYARYEVQELFQIAYNGRGEILKPLVVHHSNFDRKVEDHFEPNIGFVDTPHGSLNYDVPVRILEYIDAYMMTYLKPSPAIVYFDPRTTDYMSLATWKFAKECSVLMRRIPVSIAEDLTNCNKGVFWKLGPAFTRKMKNSCFRIQTSQGFVQGLYETLNQSKYTMYLQSIFKKLKILTLEPQNAQVNPVPTEGDRVIPDPFQNIPIIHEIFRGHNAEEDERDYWDDNSGDEGNSQGQYTTMLHSGNENTEERQFQMQEASNVDDEHTQSTLWLHNQRQQDYDTCQVDQQHDIRGLSTTHDKGINAVSCRNKIAANGTI